MDLGETFLLEKSLIGAYWFRLYDFGERYCTFPQSHTTAELKQTAQSKNLISEIRILKRMNWPASTGFMGRIFFVHLINNVHSVLHFIVALYCFRSFFEFSAI